MALDDMPGFVSTRSAESLGWWVDGLVILTGTLLFLAPFLALILVSQPQTRSRRRLLGPPIVLLVFLVYAAFLFW